MNLNTLVTTSTELRTQTSVVSDANASFTEIDKQLKSSYQFLVYQVVQTFNIKAKKNALSPTHTSIPIEFLEHIFGIDSLSHRDVELSLHGWRSSKTKIAHMCNFWRVVGFSLGVWPYKFGPYHMEPENIEGSLSLCKDVGYELLTIAQKSEIQAAIHQFSIDEELLLSHQCLLLNMANVIFVSRKRNMLAPVNRLPSETLAYIFTIISHDPITVGYNDDDDDYSRWGWADVIPSVCWYWRNIVHDTPGVWACIKEEDNLEKIKLLLKLSKDSDLSVARGYRSPYECTFLILRDIHRIRKLQLYFGERCWLQLCSELMQPAPRLEILKLSDYRYKPTLSLESLPYPTPSLKILYLRRCTMSPDRVLPQNLTQLFLENTNGISSSSFLRALQTCPKLERLALTNSPLIDMSWPFIVHLTSLQKLSINREELHMCSRFIEHLVLPDSLSWEINCSSATNINDMMDAELFPQLLKKDVQAETVRLMISELALSVDTRSTYSSHSRSVDIKTSLQLQWNTECPVDVDLVCSNALSLLRGSYWKSANVLYVNIDGTGNKFLSVNKWIDLLEMFPSVQFLGVAFCNEGNPKFLSDAEEQFAIALASADNMRLMTVSPVCPRLEHLSLRFGSSGRVLLSCLSKRKDLGIGIRKLSLYDSIGINREDIIELSDCVEELYCDTEDSSNSDEEIDEDVHSAEDYEEYSDDEVYISDTSEEEEVNYDVLDRIDGDDD